MFDHTVNYIGDDEDSLVSDDDNDDNEEEENEDADDDDVRPIMQLWNAIGRNLWKQEWWKNNFFTFLKNFSPLAATADIH